MHRGPATVPFREIALVGLQRVFPSTHGLNDSPVDSSFGSVALLFFYGLSPAPFSEHIPPAAKDQGDVYGRV